MVPIIWRGTCEKWRDVNYSSCLAQAGRNGMFRTKDQRLPVASESGHGRWLQTSAPLFGMDPGATSFPHQESGWFAIRTELPQASKLQKSRRKTSHIGWKQITENILYRNLLLQHYYGKRNHLTSQKEEHLEGRWHHRVSPWSTVFPLNKFHTDKHEVRKAKFTENL